MIERQHRFIIFVCDGCDDDLDTGTAEWDEAMEEFRAEGWRAIKGSDGEWTHRCPSCGHLPDAA